MNASPEIRDLLRAILNGECDSDSLATWLAQYSLRFLESSNKADRMIVADLDAALAEVQQGTADRDRLADTASQLNEGLGLGLVSRDKVIYIPASKLLVMTGTTSHGGTAMQVAHLEAVTSAS